MNNFYKSMGRLKSCSAYHKEMKIYEAKNEALVTQ